MRIDRFRVRHGDGRALKRLHPDSTGPFRDKAAATGRLTAALERIDGLQERLYASDRYALLLVFQGMDAAGKDSAIKHVLATANPQGTEVHAFKQPSAEELGHDFLWRAVKALPARGRIGIFNRSYYEDVVVVRVHPEFLAGQHLPPALVTSRLWNDRYEDINAFERHLARSGTVVLKFFLHVSRKEQARRLIERLDDPAKHWKFSIGDLAERSRWKDYRDAYARAIAATSHRHAPWYVVPADQKWFAHALIAEVVAETLEGLDLSLPKFGPDLARGVARARRTLTRELSRRSR